MTALATIDLPVPLAPSLTAQVLQLLAEVGTCEAPALVREIDEAPFRCVVCRKGGKLGGHHDPDGRVQWVHRRCHRRLHRSGRPAPVITPRQRRRFLAR